MLMQKKDFMVALKDNNLDMESFKQGSQNATDFLKALAHEGRLTILCRLVEGECTVTELENMLSIRQSAVSQQLARLRYDKLVKARRDGKTIYYSIADDRVKEMVSILYDMFCQ